MLGVAIGCIFGLLAVFSMFYYRAAAWICIIGCAVSLGFTLRKWLTRNAYLNKELRVLSSLGLVILIFVVGWMLMTYVPLGDPSIASKLDEITALLKSQGNVPDHKKLLEKYPLGYVIFGLDYKNEVFPYSSESILDKYDLDWSVVGYNLNSPTRVIVRMPDFKRKDGSAGVTNVIYGGPKIVGDIGAAVVGGLRVFGEILAIGDKGIVLLVGFQLDPDLP